MRNADEAPCLSNFLNPIELATLQGLLEKVLKGQCEFWDLPFPPGRIHDDATTEDEQLGVGLMEPRERVAFLADLLDQVYTITDADDENDDDESGGEGDV